ncbi:chromodomain Y-like protein [Tachypleus tridentatus]|uniref:chromodomain Y-like protein n=1 Tax=Tachypleus tridentatus TaxID=6853 RepID=UPI003FCFB9C5
MKCFKKIPLIFENDDSIPEYLKVSSLNLENNSGTKHFKKFSSAKPENNYINPKHLKIVSESSVLKHKRANSFTLREAAKQKGSLLRVALHPLNSTELFVHEDGSEEFSELLEQQHALPQGKPVASMLQEVHKSIIDSIEVKRFSKRKKALEEDCLRLSKRQSECAFRYREIAVKKHYNYIQIILVPNTIRKNSLNIECLRELKEAVVAARKDPSCKVLLLNSYGSIFCSGLDLSVLIGLHKKQIAEELAIGVKELLQTLASFPKPLVAAVNGLAVGLGVTLLTYCDVVFASDKAVFFMPYCKLGYVPEGAATLTLPQVVGSTVAADMLIRGCRATALQAQSFGLVSEVIWPTRLMEEAVPRVQAIAANHSQVMEATKAMMRCHLWEKLEITLDYEASILPKQWLTPFCQHAMKEATESGMLWE